jgi:hypothetical protein
MDRDFRRTKTRLLNGTGRRRLRGTRKHRRISTVFLLLPEHNRHAHTSDTAGVHPPLRHGSAAEVKKAIESGAPLEARDEQYGGTPLMWAAAQNKDPGAISVLLSAGANVNARDSNDGTALLWAAGANRDQEVLSLLIAAGADTDARDRSGGTMRSLLERHSLVTEAQRLLNELGYEAGMVDGKAGSRTAAAVKAFQGDRGLSQTVVSLPNWSPNFGEQRSMGLRRKKRLPLDRRLHSLSV